MIKGIFNTILKLLISHHSLFVLRRNIILTAKLLKQGYRYHKIRKAFSKFYNRHSGLIVKHNIGLKIILQQGIGNLVYKFKRIVGNPYFSDQFKN